MGRNSFIIENIGRIPTEWQDWGKLRLENFFLTEITESTEWDSSFVRITRLCENWDWDWDWDRKLLTDYCSPSPDWNGKPCDGLLYFFLAKKSDQRKLFFCQEKNNKTNKLGMESGNSFCKKNGRWEMGDWRWELREKKALSKFGVLTKLVELKSISFMLVVEKPQPSCSEHFRRRRLRWYRDWKRWFRSVLRFCGFELSLSFGERNCS